MRLCEFTKQPLALHGATISKSLIPVISHKHSSVRTLALQALCDAIIVDAAGLDDCLEPLREIAFDKSPAVREQLYILSRNWLMKLVDRYTYGFKILPLLLSGITDMLPKLSQLSETFMDEIGALYEVEWESRIKDEMDYTDGWDHLAGKYF